MNRPWPATGLGWIAAILLLVIWFLVVLGVTSFAAPHILVVAFGLILVYMLA